MIGEAPWVADPALGPADFQPFDPADVEGSLPARFARMARLHPEGVALVGTEGQYTYAQMADAVTRAARSLVDLGVGPQAPVALLFDHDAPLVVAIFAVLASGNQVLVLDPQAPAAVSQAVLGDAEPGLLLHDEAHGDQALELLGTGPDSGVQALTWEHLDAAGTAPGFDGGTELPLVAVDPGDGAMLAYTSGTTGLPKAAVLSHRALLHLMRGATDSLAIAPSDRLPMLFPLSLAVAAYPMFLPLMNGACLCTFDMRSLGLAPFPGWLAEQGISVIYFSPTVARFMGEADEADGFPQLRLVVLGGERVDEDAIAVVRARFGAHVVMGNGYGTTETGVLAFYFPAEDEAFGAAGVPVGRAIVGMDLLVTDDDGRPAAPGQTGELLVRSAYLFSGYRGQPEATERVLRPDPDHPGQAIYRTGDLGWLDDSGCLHLVGRADTEVKVRGHRVLPGEVEQALLALPGVKDAVVEGRADAEETTTLVAWVVPVGDWQEVTPADIRAELAPTVKAHLIPTHILVLDTLPQLPNGKLDRRALPEPGQWRPLPYADLVPPRDELQRELARIWERVLDVQPVGIRDDFFALGGHSLDAARMLVVVEELLGVQIPMATLLDAHTVEQLAAAIERRQADHGRRSTAVQVQAGSPDRPILFFVHDLYGTAWVLRDLAPLLGADQRLFGFESPLLNGAKSPFHDLETLAMRYVTDMRLVQPEGPYYLAGYSFGGVLGFEMARQLEAAGQTVAFLGVIDVGPGYRGKHYNSNHVLDKPWLTVPMPPDRGLPLRKRMTYYADMVRKEPVDLAYHVLFRTGLDRWSDPAQFWLDLRRTGHINAGRRVWYAWRGHWELARHYRWEGRTYPGDLTLFWAEGSASADATMGWGSIVQGRVDVVRVDVAHDEVLQPQSVDRIAGPLRAALDRALERGPSAAG